MRSRHAWIRRLQQIEAAQRARPLRTISERGLMCEQRARSVRAMREPPPTNAVHSHPFVAGPRQGV